MSEELEVLKTVTQRLTRAQIPYMVTGSIAGNFYAVPRMTRDIDLVVELSEQDVDRVVGLFRNDFYVDRELVQRAIRERATFNIIHNAFVIKVDFVVKKESAYRREEFSRRRPVSMEGQEFLIVEPLYEALRARGYREEDECMNIEGVPVQFLPAYNALVEEALTEARETRYEATPTRVLRPEHLLAIALQTGRDKDRERVRLLREQARLDQKYLNGVLTRHKLDDAWTQWKP